MLPRLPVLAPPPVWGELCAFLGLDEALAVAWWRALATSKWTVLRSWRQKLLLGEHFGEILVGAGVLLAIVTQLGHEGRLAPEEVLRITDAVLARMDATGQWR